MTIDFELVKNVAASLYDASLRKIPDDTLVALKSSLSTERHPTARNTLSIQIESAQTAQRNGHFVCSDAGIPTYVVRIGTAARLGGDLRRAIRESFEMLTKTISPPLLQHVTNPLTLERGHQGKDMPILTFDVIDGADYLEITCLPKALGSGRWSGMEVFSFPTLETIENYVMSVVLKAGSQHCPPVVVGVGIGGTFDYAAKLAKEATMRPFASRHTEPMVAAMEERLLRAINATGFGPMGTGGDTTALAVHVEYAAGHGFVPVAVEFNCWINRRASARIHNSGRVEWFE
jgi:fumarate hydratase subunit alpha